MEMIIKGQGQTKRGAKVDYLEVKNTAHSGDAPWWCMFAGLSGNRRPPIVVSQVVWFIFD